MLRIKSSSRTRTRTAYVETLFSAPQISRREKRLPGIVFKGLVVI
jgi:hypothetical protein